MQPARCTHARHHSEAACTATTTLAAVGNKQQLHWSSCGSRHASTCRTSSRCCGRVPPRTSLHKAPAQRQGRSEIVCSSRLPRQQLMPLLQVGSVPCRLASLLLQRLRVSSCNRQLQASTRQAQLSGHKVVLQLQWRVHNASAVLLGRRAVSPARRQRGGHDCNKQCQLLKPSQSDLHPADQCVFVCAGQHACM
jgi:hypothetical protein